MKRVMFLAFAVCASVSSLVAEVSGYAHSMDFSVTGYKGTTTLVNFPMLVRLNALVTGFNYQHFLSPGGADLRFTLEDGTELAHSIEEWNPQGTSFVWVKVPALTQGMRFKMYWGKANDVAPAAPVFDEAGYWSVLHCKEADGNYADATGNGNGGVAAKATLDSVTYTPSRTSGVIGKAVHLVGSELGQNEKGPSVHINNWATQTLMTDTFTIGAWFRTAAVGQATGNDILFASRQFRLTNWYGAPNNIGILDPGCNWGEASLGAILPGYLNDGRWYHIVATFSGKTYQIYANGVMVKTGTLKAEMMHEGYAMGVGNNEKNDRPSFKGDVDDIRIAPTVVSADWIAAEYQQAAPGKRFLSLDNRVVHVVPEGTAGVEPTAPYLTWATAATNIADAVAANADNDPVFIAPGRYPITTRLTLNNPGVTYSCVDPATGANVYGGAVIDGSGQKWTQAAVLLKGASMRGFTIAHVTNTVDGAKGAGLYVSASVNPDLFVADTLVTNCCLTGAVKSKPCGAGVYIEPTYAGSLTNCMIVANESPVGGGIYYISRNDPATTAHPTIRDCAFVKNVINSSWGSGGAAYVAGAVFRNCTFSGNKRLSESYSPCVDAVAYNQFIGCLFDSNGSVYGNGGSGIYLSESGNTVVRGCTFTRNVSSAYSGAGWLENCILTNNYGRGATGCANLRNCLVACNGDSGVYNYMASRTNRIENCTIVSNKTAGVKSDTDSQYSGCSIIVNSILTDNDTASVHHYDYISWKKYNDCIVSNSVITVLFKDGGHDASQDQNRWDFTMSEIRFADAANGDYSLIRKSPCKDKGLLLGYTAESTDLVGNPRVMKDGRTLAKDPAARPDLGCYENVENAPGMILYVR